MIWWSWKQMSFVLEGEPVCDWISLPRRGHKAECAESIWGQSSRVTCTLDCSPQLAAASVLRRKKRYVAQVRCLKWSYRMFWRCTFHQHHLLASAQHRRCTRHHFDSLNLTLNFVILTGLWTFWLKVVRFPESRPVRANFHQISKLIQMVDLGNMSIYPVVWL